MSDHQYRAFWMEKKHDWMEQLSVDPTYIRFLIKALGYYIESVKVLGRFMW